MLEVEGDIWREIVLRKMWRMRGRDGERGRERNGKRREGWREKWEKERGVEVKKGR